MSRQREQAMATEIANLVEVGGSFAQSYAPVLDFDGWRVAMLRHFSVVASENLHRVERHRNTNEVFILTAGHADLILFAGDDSPVTPHVIAMAPSVAYNVRRAVWHHVVMSPDAHIVLVERSDTGAENTDYAELSPDIIEQVRSRLSVTDT